MPEPSASQSVGYNRGGVIERGAVAMGAFSSSNAPGSSNAPAVPRAYAPLVEEWALVSDDDAEEEPEDINVNNEEEV